MKQLNLNYEALELQNSLHEKEVKELATNKLYEKSTSSEKLIEKQQPFTLKKAKDNKKKLKAISLKIDKGIVDECDKVRKEAGLDRNKYIEMCVDYCNKNVKWE